MKKIIFLSSLFLIYSCVTVKKHNEKLEIPISAENLKKDVETFKLTENGSYVDAYSEFINYFKNLDGIERHNLVIASHF